MLDMGIIKVEINFPELRQALKEFRVRPKRAFEKLSTEIRKATGHAVLLFRQTYLQMICYWKLN